MENIVQFQSIEYLRKYLEENKTFVFSSKPRKLSHFRILLFALATRDFNPAHIVSDFADKSIFKGVVSHGIGTVSRAEATYVEMVTFKEPVELIALGYENIHYYKPMRVGHTYQYDYTISKMVQEKSRWDFECHVICKTTKPEEKVIAEWIWKTSYVPNLQLSLEDRKVLRPKSYLWNVFNYLFFKPIATTALMMIGIFLVFGGVIVLTLQLFRIIPPGQDYIIGH